MHVAKTCAFRNDSVVKCGIKVIYCICLHRKCECLLLFQLQMHWCNTSVRRNISCTESGFLLNGNLLNLGK